MSEEPGEPAIFRGCSTGNELGTGQGGVAHGVVDILFRAKFAGEA